VNPVADAPYALALAAGTLAAVNPCGFALLPTYVSLLVLPDRTGAATPGDTRGRALGQAVGRALLMTGAMTGGFIAVFAAFGLVVAPLALSVERYLPWVTVVIGIGLVGLGAWLVAGREIYLAVPRLRAGKPTLSPASLVLYGASYAIASLSCTIGPFLALTTSAFRSSSLLAGLGVFVAYAAGMGLVVGVVTLAAAFARGTVAGRLRRVMRHVSRAGGVLLVLGGGYVAYYGAYEIRVLSGAGTGDPVVDAAVRMQSHLVRWLDSVGPGRMAVACAMLMVVVGVAARRNSRAPAAGQPQPQLPPQHPPAEAAAVPAACAPNLPATDTVDSSFTVSAWPSGQGAGEAESLIGRDSSKEVPQTRHRYS
jgi:cytochrome c biogenesis protein CcdA